MNKSKINKISKITLSLFLFGFLIIPSVGHAQINAQGIGGLLIQCAKVTSANQEDFGPSTDSAEQRAVKTTENNAKKLVKKEACSDAIAKYTMGELLKKMSQEAVNWINGGFRGDPAFVQNPEAYFQSIATQQLSSLTSLLQFNAEDLPFGRESARSIILSEISGSFENRARFTLNNYIPTGNLADFQADFRIGGWDAFLHQAFDTQNNPGGFAILATQEKERRLAGRNDLQSEIQLASKELQQNSGFLSLKKCVESKANGEYIPPEEEGGVLVSEAQYESRAAYELYENDDMAAAAENLSHVCKTWENQTPGTVIAHALNKTIIDIPIEQSVIADELNESLNVVFSALLNQVFKNGVKSLENTQDWAQEGLNSVNIGSIGLGDLLMDPVGTLGAEFGGGDQDYFGGNGLNISDFETAQGDLLGWSQQGENFDIFNQLPYIIYLQERFIGSPNGVIPELPVDPETGEVGIDQSTGEPFVDPTPGFNGVIQQTAMLNESILNLEQLDVCIPGPSPMYKRYLGEALKHWEGEIMKAQEQMLNVFGIFDPGGITAGTVQDNTQKGIQRLRGAADQYMELIDTKYNWLTPGNMPSITPAANNEIAKIDQYMATIAKNSQISQEVSSQLVSLEYLLQKIEELKVNAPNMPVEVVKAQGDALVQAFYESAPSAVTAEDIVKLQSSAILAEANNLKVQTYAQQCLDENLSQDYSGQTRFQWYRSRTNPSIVLGSSSRPTNPNNVPSSPVPPGDSGNFLYNPQPILEYGQHEAGVIIAQIMGIMQGKISGYTVLQTLTNEGVLPPDFSPGTQWFETLLGWSYPGQNSIQ